MEKERTRIKIAKSEAEELKRALDHVESKVRIRTNRKQHYTDIVLHHQDKDAYVGNLLYGDTASPSLYNLYKKMGEKGRYIHPKCRRDKGTEDIWILTGKIARDFLFQMEEEGIIEGTTFEKYMPIMHRFEDTYGDKELSKQTRKIRRNKMMKEINNILKVQTKVKYMGEEIVE